MKTPISLMPQKLLMARWQKRWPRRLGSTLISHETALKVANTIWSLVHGLADLIISGRLGYIGKLPDPARQAAVREMLASAIAPIIDAANREMETLPLS